MKALLECYNIGIFNIRICSKNTPKEVASMKIVQWRLLKTPKSIRIETIQSLDSRPACVYRLMFSAKLCCLDWSNINSPHFLVAATERHLDRWNDFNLFDLQLCQDSWLSSAESVLKEAADVRLLQSESDSLPVGTHDDQRNELAQRLTEFFIKFGG